MTQGTREVACRNCANSFTYTSGGGLDRPLCTACEASHKWCPSCGYALSRVGFHADPRNRDRLEGSCKQCKSRAHFARYQGKYRTDPRKARNSKILNRYGLSSAEWDRMVIAHAGRCAICEKATADLHIDHCHATGMVRGLLCHQCNVGIGHFGDDVDRMLTAISYLETSRSVGVEG